MLLRHISFLHFPVEFFVPVLMAVSRKALSLDKYVHSLSYMCAGIISTMGYFVYSLRNEELWNIICFY